MSADATRARELLRVAVMATHDASNDLADPAHEAEQRAERAKASLLSRVETLKHKLSDAKHMLSDAKEVLDLPAQISKHALPAVGIAFALGVAAGMRRGGSAPAGEGGGVVRSALWSALAAVGMRALREIAMGQLGKVAKQWWDEHNGAEHPEGPPPSPSNSPFVGR
jgi:ElaB/YqjD/DUF883 family membrane-anchored ribosome-binding protein